MQNPFSKTSSAVNCEPVRHEIRPLTGVRGVAAAWVVLYHIYMYQDRSSWPRPLEAVLLHGCLAVDVFFILSGFVMALSSRHFFADGFAPGKYVVFLVRRIARVCPLHWAVLVFIVLRFAAGLGGGWDGNWADVLPNLLFVPELGRSAPMNDPTWSVAVELIAYVLFPLLAAAALFSGRGVALALGAACLAVIALLVHGGFHYAIHKSSALDYTDLRSWQTYARGMAEFTLGLLTFRLALLPGIAAWFIRRPLTELILAAIALLLAWPAADFLVVLLTCPLIIGLAVGRGLSVRLFGVLPVFLLGEVSYSVYLLHAQFLDLRFLGRNYLQAVLGQGGAQFASAFFVLVPLIPCSYATYRLIETPARLKIRNMEKAWSLRQDAQAASRKERGRTDISRQGGNDAAPARTALD